ncbi:hypothetical protein ACE10Z_37240 [Bradyrhizobium sp. Pha-3]|uniref:hypothetical protein n=1 Tax=Bradyrhizobium sp. Pha-3 TaxID=208375 RepID=UPI0035D49C3A
MPEVRPAGPYPLDGIDLETWLVRFDKNGVCTSPGTRAALLAALAATPTSPVLFFSHGWNNDFADAVDLYRTFLSRLQEVLQTNPLPPGPAPIFVGITWPSIWLPSDSGPQMAAAGPRGQDPETERVAEELLDILPSSTDWNRFYQLIDAARLTQAEAKELASMLVPAVKADSVGPDEATASEDKIVAAMNAMQAARGGAPNRDNLDDFGTADGAARPGLGAAGILSYLDPRWAVRLASLYIMKDRAGTVGSNGVAALLQDIKQSTHGLLHMVGHSFGAKVMLSALAAQPANGSLARSLLLLQPAVSYLSFAATVPGREGPGGYRSVLDRVVNPIVTTYSNHDIPLHEIYHLALLRREDLGDLQIAAGETAAGNPPNAYAALGGYGPRGADQRLVNTIPGPGEALDLAGARLIGLDGSVPNRIGSHGGVATEFTAWTLRALMALP